MLALVIASAVIQPGQGAPSDSEVQELKLRVKQGDSEVQELKLRVEKLELLAASMHQTKAAQPHEERPEKRVTVMQSMPSCSSYTRDLYGMLTFATACDDATNAQRLEDCKQECDAPDTCKLVGSLFTAMVYCTGNLKPPEPEPEPVGLQCGQGDNFAGQLEVGHYLCLTTCMTADMYQECATNCKGDNCGTWCTDDASGNPLAEGRCGQ
jgi:hypothetical protein